MSKYSELLKDPRWYGKRSEILIRDNLKCRICKNDEYTLNVHHQCYLYGLLPWEYPNDLLITLCEFCHKGEEGLKPHDHDYMRSLLSSGTPRLKIQMLTKAILKGVSDKGIDEFTKSILQSNQ